MHLHSFKRSEEKKITKHDDDKLPKFPQWDVPDSKLDCVESCNGCLTV